MMYEKPSVLIVDDDSEALKAISARLDPLRFRAVTCRYGRGAFEYIAENKPALVLMDASLLYLQGADTFQPMKASSPQTRVVFLDSDGPWTLLMDLPGQETHEMLINPCVREDVPRVVEQLIRIQAG